MEKIALLHTPSLHPASGRIDSLMALIGKLALSVTLFLLSAAQPLRAANYYEEYIQKYADMAVEQMHEYGVPASITLAQGLLESAAGRSTLAREGNNHFGIKCHKEWDGASMLRNDDRPNECFRVYSSAAESFRDHSIFLRRNRYASLFDLDPTDYEGWARGLKRCGYATDPNYAERLISIIELYSLQNFDVAGFNRFNKSDAAETAEFIHKMLKRTHVVRRNRGLHYVIAQPGDTYFKIARELNVNPNQLLRFNDAEKDGEIKAWEEVYLQEKLDEAPKDVAKVTIGEGESMHSIAQRFGMKLSTLRNLNPTASDSAGQILRLN